MVIEAGKSKHGLDRLDRSAGGIGATGMQNMSEIIRGVVSRLAIYRKLKELGYSDEWIFTIYKKSDREN
ncbi:MAG: hypothetical protein GY940_35485 [bacterium]|nr:hypothetical protein [bacterium]